MIITEIRKRGKGERYYIYADYKFYAMFEAEILAKSGLKTGNEICESELNQLALESGRISAFTTAINYLSRGMKTKKKMQDYLKEKGYIPETVQDTLLKLEEYGYVNDEEFAKAYIETYKNAKGNFRLRLELKEKGVSEEVIESFIEQNNDESEAVEGIVLKFLRTHRERDQKTREKLVRQALSKGFSYEDVKKCINKFWENEEI